MDNNNIFSAGNDAPEFLHSEHAQRFNAASNAQELLIGNLNLKDRVAAAEKDIVDQGGQLKTIPALAAAIHTNFTI